MLSGSPEQAPMSDEKLPAPLTPPDCDLRGLPFMPLDVIRLVDSDFAALCSGEEFKAGVTLWCKSWLQVPAGSLPDDDRILAHLTGTGQGWADLRKNALHGWIKCSDGRLYHPVVAEKALEALPARREHQARKSSEADRKAREREDRKKLFEDLRAVGIVPEYNEKTSALRALHSKHVTPDVTDNVTQVTGHVTEVTPPVTPPVTAKTGTGTGTGTDIYSVSNDTGAAAPPVDPVKVMFDLAVEVLTPYCKKPAEARQHAGRWRRARDPAWVTQALTAARDEGVGNPIEWIEGRLRRSSAEEDERAAWRRLTIEEYRQHDARMEGQS